MDELKEWERKYLDEMNKGGASNETRFMYAKSIIKTRHVFRQDLERAVILLEDLCVRDDRESRKDYLFHLAIAHTKLAEYGRAEDCIKKFMVLEPGNRQAHELYDIIQKKIAQERVKDAAIAGGTAILIGGLVGLGMALASRK